MTETTAQTVGVDNKDTLDLHLHPAGSTRRLTNDPKRLTPLISWLRELPITRIIFGRGGFVGGRETGCRHPVHKEDQSIAMGGMLQPTVSPRRVAMKTSFRSRTVGVGSYDKELTLISVANWHFEYSKPRFQVGAEECFRSYGTQRSEIGL